TGRKSSPTHARHRVPPPDRLPLPTPPQKRPTPWRRPQHQPQPTAHLPETPRPVCRYGGVATPLPPPRVKNRHGPPLAPPPRRRASASSVTPYADRTPPDHRRTHDGSRHPHLAAGRPPGTHPRGTPCPGPVPGRPQALPHLRPRP